ncbi:hypothetical protein BKA62DRAFT_427616 [Auriculariales sp. MPI-PUGE-AT-0066]|nr:hypothetical protein BKA62DRAFT_427616 [Auriculariales sp. MPI-PUGE-AT-0066]
MPREDSGESSGASLTSDEEVFEDIRDAQSPTYRTNNPELPPPTRKSVDAGRKSVDAARSTRRGAGGSTAPTHPPLGPHAKRLRAAVRRVINTHRTSKMGAGAEPGVDPRKPASHQQYGHLTQLCTIDVIDYSAVSTRFKRFNNGDLKQWFKTDESKRPPWARVRWIHVNAISWDVLALLGTTGGLEMHPLALEDVLQSRTSSRSKASYYSSQLFLRVLCHTLADEEVRTHPQQFNMPRSESPVPLDESSEKVIDPDATLGKNSTMQPGSKSSTMRPSPSRQSTRMTLEQQRWQNRDADINRRAREAKLNVIKDQEHRIDVNLNNVFIFLWRDGTVLSIHANPGSCLFDPIRERLRSRDTILRQTVDPSLLVESLLDLVVDEATEVVDRYQDTLHKLEAAVLSKAKMRLVRSLHIISGDLATLKRSLDPVKSLIFGLRRYDLDRCVAVAAAAEASRNEGKTQAEIETEKKEKLPVVGFMSHKSKIYLADVHDHIDHAMSSLDLFASVTENLISYTFNISGYQTNETMRRLTLVTIICLPLTLLTGYFGMNFATMWSVQNNSDLLFWKIGIPMLVVIAPLFVAADIVRGIHKIKKMLAAKAASRAIKESQPPPRINSGRQTV